MKLIHSEVPELSEEIIPRSTQEENEIPLQDINIKSGKELKYIPIYSEEEMINNSDIRKKLAKKKMLLKLIKLLIRDTINFVVVGLLGYFIFKFLNRNNLI